MIELRPYQTALIERLWSAVDTGQRHPLIVAPTGSGKTVIAGQLIGDTVKQGQRVLFLAHRRELIAQASCKLHAVGIDHGIIQAGFPGRPSERVQVASVQTLHARAIRSTRIELPPADLVVVDEAHHAPARTYRDIAEAYPDAVLVGLTATPCRADGRGLGKIFDTLVECPSVADLIAGGFLVPTRVYAPTRPDLKGVQVKRGDYVESQLAERMDQQELTGDIVMHWHRLSGGRPTVVFATSVAHSVNLRNEFRASGVMAEHLDGSTPAQERDGILAKLRSGEIDVVTNCMVLTEGWDAPEVSCLVLARPTKSIGLYLQMIGRVMRPAPAKVDALILDHAGAVFEHGFAEDPVIWTLKEDRRAARPAQTARSGYLAPELTTCPECKAVRMSGQPCSACGWRPQPKPNQVEVRDGELSQVNRARKALPIEYSMDAKRSWYQQLLSIARDRGYQPGWAAHKFKEKFGAWPERRWPSLPVAPTPEVKAWVRSRQIAYAKGMAKRVAA